MRTIALVMCCGVLALSLTSNAAMSQDRLIGKLSLSAVSDSCPTTLVLADQTVPVNFLMPEARTQAHPPVQNRFRFNFMEPATVAHSVTITGQIANYGAPGCTVAFKGEGLSYD